LKIPPFNAYLGAEVVLKESGRVEVALELAPHHLNRRGVAHGGVVTSLLDSALGGAVISSIPPEWWCATTSLSTQFLTGPGVGQLRAVGRVTRRGSRVAFADGEARDESGRVVATAQGTWHLWSRKPGRPRRDAPPPGHVVLGATGESIRVGKILAVGRNYAEHAREMGAEPRDEPVAFLKPATSLAAGGGVLRIPADRGAVHHEVELVVLIGKAGSSISEKSAAEHVLGYGVGLVLTLRYVQAEAKRRGEPWSLSKGFDGAAPVSAFVPRSEVGDGSGLGIALDTGGREVQHGNTSQMIHSVDRLVSWASDWMRLERGDLLFTGTPAGVGPVCAGDRLKARIDRVGTLEVEIG